MVIRPLKDASYSVQSPVAELVYGEAAHSLSVCLFLNALALLTDFAYLQPFGGNFKGDFSTQRFGRDVAGRITVVFRSGGGGIVHCRRRSIS